MSRGLASRAPGRSAVVTVVLTVSVSLMSLRAGNVGAETGYTLPFYASHEVKCDFGVLYTSCGVDLPGTHQGIDYSVGKNTTGGEVIATAAAGTARYCAETSIAGKSVLIDHGGQNRTRYLHLSDWARPEGSIQDVARGEIVGYEGTTGYSTGNHLHFETRQGATSFDCSLQTSGTAVDPGGLWQNNPPNPADFAPAVASHQSSRVDVFVRTKNNGLYQKTWNGSSWTGWLNPKPNDCLKSGPAATTWSTTRVDVFYRGCNDGVYWTTWVGGSWTASVQPGQNHCTLGAPAVASWSNHMELFYRGCDNAIYRSVWNGGWSAAGQPFPACLRSGPGAVSWGTGRIDVVYRGCDDAIYHHWNDGGSWGVESFGGCTMVAPSIASWASQRLDVYHRGCTSPWEGPFQKSWNGSSWTGWSFIGGCLASAGGVEAWAPDWLDTFYRSCDSPSNLYKAYYNGSSWQHSLFSSWP